jgi:radical SAM family uncharacterized protein
MNMRQIIEEQILPRVTRPIRYQGNEYNAVHKDWEKSTIRTVFAFPDLYEVAMSHLGLQILYGLVNNEEDLLMERVFAPWTDMEELLREKGICLFSLESYRPIKEFDFIGFTLQYEMSFTNILNMLDLSDIPLRAAERDDSYPIVIGGGPCAYNPEPLADFFDLIVLGDGEEAILEVLKLAKNHKKQGRIAKEPFLKEAAKLQGVYIPGFYEAEYGSDGRFKGIKPIHPNAPAKIIKNVVEDLNKTYFPTEPIVPYADTVHDRVMLEVLRGCTRSCRFCQAGVIYRPVRERSQETLLKQAKDLVKATGHNEISLTSLSTADYTCVQPLITSLMDEFQDNNVGVSLPSLRVDAFSVDLAKEIQKVRKTGLTFAPEAGSQRMRDVINKGVTEEDLIEAVTGAFKAGWTTIKLYFMIGLPTETMEDVAGIADLAFKVVKAGKQILKGTKTRKPVKVTVSVSSFVPKAHTPFQWAPQDTIEQLEEKQQYLKSLLKGKNIVFNYHDAPLSFLEAVFAKGDRRLGGVLEQAFKLGCKFDSWSEHFNYNLWLKAFDDCQIDPANYAYGKLKFEDVLPWDHLATGVKKEYLYQEYEKALAQELTNDCRLERCTSCGVCGDLNVKLMLQRRR